MHFYRKQIYCTVCLALQTLPSKHIKFEYYSACRLNVTVLMESFLYFNFIENELKVWLGYGSDDGDV